MPHARAQIRQAVAIILTGLATTGANAFTSRVHPLTEVNMPALRIYAVDEQSDQESTLGPVERQLDLVVEAVAKASAGLDDTLDQMCLEVETVLLANVPAGVEILDPPNTHIELIGEADQKIGVATMTFPVSYTTAFGDPGTFA